MSNFGSLTRPAARRANQRRRARGTGRRVIALCVSAAFVAVACSSTGSSGGSGAAPAPTVTQASGSTNNNAPVVQPSTGPSSSTGATKQLGTLTIATHPADAGKWAIYAGIANGSFKQAGISLKIVATSGGSNTISQIIAGNADLAEGAFTDVIVAHAQGAPIEVVGGEQAKLPYMLNAQKGITTINQLAGKTVSISALNDITRLTVDGMLKAAGMTHDDVKYSLSPSTASRFAALKAGAVQASILSTPINFEAQAAGYKAVATAGDSVSYPYLGLIATSSWVKSNKAKLLAFLKGYLQSIAWLYEPANREAAVKILVNATDTSQAAGEQAYDYFATQLKTFPTGGLVDVDAVTQLMSAMKALGVVPKTFPTSEIVDNSFVKEAAAD